MRRFIKLVPSILSKNNLPFIALLLTGAFFRLFRLQEFTVFLSDQGRDAIIVKDIVTLHHFPLIGAPTSIGQVFLGPAYYYLVAPFLLLFNFNPVGLVYGVVFYVLVGAIACYVIIKKEIDVHVALLFTFLVLFSSVQIELSRFSWNPNLLPLSAFFSLYFLYKLFEKHTLIYAILFGSFLGLAIQFHYLALLMLPAIGVFYGYNLITNTTIHKTLLQFKSILLYIVAPLFSFIASISPLILFDLRHGFINVINFLKLFSEQKNTPHELLSTRVLNVNNAFFNLFFHTEFSVSMAVLIGVTIFVVYIIVSRTRKVPAFIHLNALVVFLFMIF